EQVHRVMRVKIDDHGQRARTSGRPHHTGPGEAGPEGVGREDGLRCNLCCCLGIEEADTPTQAFDACRPVGGLTGSFWDRAGNRADWSALLLLTAARDLLVRPRSAVGPP